MSNVIETIKKRSSTRGYTPENLTDAELQTLLHAGLQAPTAANRQEIHFTVLKGDHPILAELEAEKNRLRDLTKLEHNFYYEAPVVIIGCIYDALRGEKKEYFSKALKLPENYEYEIAIAFGHKAVTKEPHTYDADAQITYLS